MRNFDEVSEARVDRLGGSDAEDPLTAISGRLGGNNVADLELASQEVRAVETHPTRLLRTESDPALDALLAALGREQLLDELDGWTGQFEEECEDLVSFRFDGEDDFEVGEVAWWNLLWLRREQSDLTALVEGVVKLFYPDDEDSPYMKGSPVYVRVSLREADGVWHFASGEVLEDEDMPGVGS